ncbi:MAG: (deoxy)nucleoside triphosphate pyrophosphohydrolase [Bacteroidales bacterium]|nr:(deoxy)nucleoside triphosphate pyrophosphohydrolase [Bacteroidales bacterium]
MKQIEVVAAIIRKGKLFFATQRGYGEFEGWWEFPGGKMEAGETREEALIREIREELSAEIVIEKYLTTVEWDYPKFHLILHCFICRTVSEAMHLNEHEAARWLDGKSAGSVRWLPADEQIIPLILRDLEQC